MTESRTADNLGRLTAFLAEDLLKYKDTHALIYGEPAETSQVLRAVYESATQHEGFLCSYHQASKIQTPLDFFIPLLKLKYSEEEYSSRIKPLIQTLERNEEEAIFNLAAFCGQEEKAKSPQAHKWPVIFIEGIDQFLFRMDFPHLDPELARKYLEMKQKRDSGEEYQPVELPPDKGLGNNLRKSLHHEKKAVFFGSVNDAEGIEYHTTLGNPNYLFYEHNFRLCYSDEWRTVKK